MDDLARSGHDEEQRRSKPPSMFNIFNLFASPQPDLFTVVKWQLLHTSDVFLKEIGALLESLYGVLHEVPILDTSLQAIEVVIVNCPGLHDSARQYAQAGDSFLEAVATMVREKREMHGLDARIAQEALRFTHSFSALTKVRVADIILILQEAQSKLLDFRQHISSEVFNTGNRQINVDFRTIERKLDRLADRMARLQAAERRQLQRDREEL